MSIVVGAPEGRPATRPGQVSRGGEDASLLCRAAEKGLVASVRSQLARGVDPDAKDEHGQVPLHYAAANGHAEVARLLLGAGADPDVSGTRGWAPLHLAVSADSAEIIELLAARGADVNVRDDAGLTPLHHAAGANREEAASALLAHAEVDAVDHWGWAPLHHAAYDEHLGIMKLLLANRANPNVTNNAGRTPLAEARRRGRARAVALLRAHGGEE